VKRRHSVLDAHGAIERAVPETEPRRVHEREVTAREAAERPLPAHETFKRGIDAAHERRRARERLEDPPVPASKLEDGRSRRELPENMIDLGLQVLLHARGSDLVHAFEPLRGQSFLIVARHVRNAPGAPSEATRAGPRPP